jgi:hypothetical protein
MYLKEYIHEIIKKWLFINIKTLIYDEYCLYRPVQICKDDKGSRSQHNNFRACLGRRCMYSNFLFKVNT